MSSRVTSILLLIVVSTLAGCHRTQSAPPYEELRTGWAADLAAHRLEPSLARYSADAIFMDPQGGHNVGQDQIRPLFVSVFNAFDAQIDFSSRATEQSGDLAYDSGSYVESVTERATHVTHHLLGDYLTVYRHESGKWLIVQQVWTEAKLAQ